MDLGESEASLVYLASSKLVRPSHKNNKIKQNTNESKTP